MVHATTLPRSLLLIPVLAALAACGSGELSSPTSLPDPTPAITGLSVTPEALTLPYLGATSQLTATLVNSQGDPVTPPRIYWVSLDTLVATVDSTGLVTGVRLGTARIRAQFLELADTTAITVARVPVSMDLSVDSLLITALGRTVMVQSTVWDGAPSQIPEADVAWTSSDGTVASVDSTGAVKALADGITVISATADTVVRTFKVRVASRPASMTVTPSSISLDGVSDTSRVVTVLRDAAGHSTYPDLQPTYTSSDTTVATVDFIGFVIARKAGTATISVVADTLTASVPVAVIQTAHSVRIVPDTATVAVGETTSYVALVKDRFAHLIPHAAVTWTSSDPSVATVDVDGTVTGIAAGSVTLTASSGDVSDTAQVTVAVASP